MTNNNAGPCRVDRAPDGSGDATFRERWTCARLLDVRRGEIDRPRTILADRDGPGIINATDAARQYAAEQMQAAAEADGCPVQPGESIGVAVLLHLGLALFFTITAEASIEFEATPAEAQR